MGDAKKIMVQYKPAIALPRELVNFIPKSETGVYCILFWTKAIRIYPILDLLVYTK